MVPARSVSDLVHESPLRAPSSWNHGQNTDKTIKGFGTLIPKPLICWLRGLDVNQRPLGYEPTPGPDCNRLLPIKAPETRASPSLPLGSDRRLLEGVPAQFQHKRLAASLPHTGDHQDWNFCARLTSATRMFSGTSMGGPHLLPDAGELTGLLSVNWSPT